MRVLIKISGESLSSKDKIFDDVVLNKLANQIKRINELNVGIGIVIGGGNIVRGKAFEKMGFNRVDGDHMGMLATTLNCMALCSSLKANGLKAHVMSATVVDGVDPIDVAKANEMIENNTVVLFGGGIGNPYFTTDTACALRAIEINAELILMAKNGTDGVYDKDPNKFEDAKRFDTLTFNDILNMDLKVMDATAAGLMANNNIKAFVFNANEEDCLVKAIKNEIKGTVISA